jgi:hypothetical protein
VDLYGIWRVQNKVHWGRIGFVGGLRIFWFLGTLDTDKKFHAGNSNISSDALKLDLVGCWFR